MIVLMSEATGKSLKNIAKGTSLLFIGTMIGMFLWFLIKIIIVRKLSPDAFGLYTLALSVVGILGIASYLGIQQGVTRYVSTNLGQGNTEAAHDVSRAALHITFLSSMFIAALLIVFADYAARHVFYIPEFALPLRIAAISLPLSVLTGTYINILRGWGIFIQKVLFEDIGQSLLYLVLVLLILPSGLSPVNLLSVLLVALVVILFLIVVYARKKIGFVIFRAGQNYGALLSFSLPLMIVGISATFLKWTDTLMLGRYASAADVGIYNVAVSLAQLMLFFLSALGFVFLPLAGELYGQEQMDELKRTYQVLTKWIFSAVLPVFFILFFFPEMVISFLFGNNFLGSALPLRLLALGFLFHTFLGTNGMLLTAIGYPKAIMKISVTAAVLNIIINYIFLKPMGLGVFGAALATMLSYTFINVAQSITLHRISGIHPLTRRYLKPVVASVVVGAAVYALAKSLPLYLWMMPLYLLLFVGGYGFSILLTRSVELEDVDLLEHIILRAGLRMDRFIMFLKRHALKSV